MKKLVYIVNVDWFFLSHRLPLALAARDAGYDVSVITADTGDCAVIQQYGIKVYSVPFARSFAHPFHEWKCFKRVGLLLKELKPDVVHCVALKAVILGGWPARRLGVSRVVCTVTGMGSTFIRKSWRSQIWQALVRQGLNRLFSGEGFRVIVQNTDDYQAFLQQNLAPVSRVVLIRGSGVDLNKFHPVEEPSPESEGFQVVLPARMLRDKGVGEFVEAARIIHSSGVKVRMILAGGLDPHNPTALTRDTIEKWVQEKLVIWRGEISDMVTLYQSSHVVVLPSYREGLPKVLIEAGACGRASITTDVPGCREIIQNNINGLLVPVCDSKNLAEAILTLCRNEERRRQMGREARKIVEAEYELDSVNRRTLELYQ